MAFVPDNGFKTVCQMKWVNSITLPQSDSIIPTTSERYSASLCTSTSTSTVTSTSTQVLTQIVSIGVLFDVVGRSMRNQGGRTRREQGVAEASTGSATIHAHSPNNPPNNPRSARCVPCPTDTLPSAERPSCAVVTRERLMCWSVRCRAAGALHVRSCDMTVEQHSALRDLATCNAMRRWACALPRDTPGTQRSD